MGWTRTLLLIVAVVAGSRRRWRGSETRRRRGRATARRGLRVAGGWLERVDLVRCWTWLSWSCERSGTRSSRSVVLLLRPRPHLPLCAPRSGLRAAAPAHLSPTRRPGLAPHRIAAASAHLFLPLPSLKLLVLSTAASRACLAERDSGRGFYIPLKADARARGSAGLAPRSHRASSPRRFPAVTRPRAVLLRARCDRALSRAGRFRDALLAAAVGSRAPRRPTSGAEPDALALPARFPAVQLGVFASQSRRAALSRPCAIRSA